LLTAESAAYILALNVTDDQTVIKFSYIRHNDNVMCYQNTYIISINSVSGWICTNMLCVSETSPCRARRQGTAFPSNWGLQLCPSRHL